MVNKKQNKVIYSSRTAKDYENQQKKKITIIVIIIMGIVRNATMITTITITYLKRSVMILIPPLRHDQ